MRRASEKPRPGYFLHVGGYCSHPSAAARLCGIKSKVTVTGFASADGHQLVSKSEFLDREEAEWLLAA